MATAEESTTVRRRSALARRLVSGCIVLGLLIWSSSLRAEARAPADATAAPAKPTEAALAAASTADPQVIARGVVERFHHELIDVMKKSDELPFDDRESIMGRAIDQTFDMVLMAKASIGAAWKELDETGRAAWVGLSREYSASNYANNFVGWSGQKFETRGVEPAARGTILVKTEFVQKSGDDVLFDYRLRKIKDNWRVIDVQIDGKVSEITLRRANYVSVIQRKGFPQLINEVEKKVEEFRTE
jgi:phospholipid transport system substrate-binding protein